MMHVNNLGQQRAYVAAQRREMEKSGRHAQLGEAIPVPGLSNAESRSPFRYSSATISLVCSRSRSPVPRSFGEHGRDLVSIISNQIARRDPQRGWRAAQTRRGGLQEANASLEARVAERTAALEQVRVAQALLNEARTRVDGPLLGSSPAVRGLRDAIARQARSIEPLLLTGPAGAGKEAVARAVHDASGRSGAFIFVSCGEVTTQYRHGGEADAPHDADESLLGSRFEHRAVRSFSMRCTSCRLRCRMASTSPIERERSRLSRGESGVPDGRLIASTTHDLRQPPPGAFPPLFQALGANRVSVPPLVDRRRTSRRSSIISCVGMPGVSGKVIDDVSPDSMRRLEAARGPATSAS